MDYFNELKWLKDDMEKSETEVEMIETGFIKMFTRIVAEANAVTGGCADVVDAMIDASNRIFDMAKIVETERAIHEGKTKKYLEAIDRKAQEAKEKSAADAEKSVKAADVFKEACKGSRCGG